MVLKNLAIDGKDIRKITQWCSKCQIWIKELGGSAQVQERIVVIKNWTLRQSREAHPAYQSGKRKVTETQCYKAKRYELDVGS